MRKEDRQKGTVTAQTNKPPSPTKKNPPRIFKTYNVHALRFIQARIIAGRFFVLFYFGLLLCRIRFPEEISRFGWYVLGGVVKTAGGPGLDILSNKKDVKREY